MEALRKASSRQRNPAFAFPAFRNIRYPLTRRNRIPDSTRGCDYRPFPLHMNDSIPVRLRRSATNAKLSMRQPKDLVRNRDRAMVLAGIAGTCLCRHESRGSVQSREQMAGGRLSCMLAGMRNIHACFQTDECLETDYSPRDLLSRESS